MLIQAVIVSAFVGAWTSGNSSMPTVCAPDSHDGHHRSGHPERLACYAQPSNDCNYSSGYVGGGSQFHGCGRFAQEGTWGRDYCGWLVSHRPWLKWSHGRRNQGGSGAYKTDGPHLLKH
jgi:hypothetical protein